MYPFDHLPAPLTNADFYILLVLSHEDSYAYALKGLVMNVSLGSVNLRPSTLYPALERLHSVGLIEMKGVRPGRNSGNGRMHYGISEEGLVRLKEEARRYEHAVEIMRTAGLLDEELPLDIQRLILRSSDRLE